jgi:UDP-N-acetylmuramoyl-tripeptide--D-alanyl-D-alanine ligase
MRFTTDELADVTGGVAFGPTAVIDGATQDSRAVEPGQLFVPLLAERDGHDFIGGALERGATAYVTSRPPEAGSGVQVADTMEALRAIGAAARARVPGPVVGITGSVGKTSTKDLLASVLRRHRPTHASAKSFNNEIGVPLTLLNTPDDAQMAVVEMGARGIGHIEDLCAIVHPTIGVVTTVAGAHTGEFGSVEAIAVAKGELVEALPADGLAVLNADVPLAAGMRDRTAAEVLTFGRSADADVRIVDVRLDAELRATIELESRWGNLTVSPSTRGAHLAPNAAAAAAVAWWIGASADDIVAGLAAAPLSPWRMELSRTTGGALIINDAYNANPTSMRGALNSLAALPPGGRRIAVIGYMAELGDDERHDHEDIAAHAAALGIDVVAVGTDLYGLPAHPDPIAAIGQLAADDAVLIKASRSAGLERLIDDLG